MLRVPPEGGPVYTVAAIDDQTKVKHVHRSLLKAMVGTTLSVLAPGSGSPPCEQHARDNDVSSEGDLLLLGPEPQQPTSVVPPAHPVAGMQPPFMGPQLHSVGVDSGPVLPPLDH